MREFLFGASDWFGWLVGLVGRFWLVGFGWSVLVGRFWSVGRSFSEIVWNGTGGRNKVAFTTQFASPGKQ